MMGARWSWMLVLATLLASGAGAETRDEQLRACAGLGGETPDARIKACSTVIAGGREGSDRLAAVFFNPGKGYFVTRPLLFAVAAFEQVVRLEPALAMPFTKRGR